MKNLKLIIGTVVISVFLTSCYTSKVSAPYGKKVELASEGEYMPYKKVRKNWYAVWGLVNISNNDIEDLIIKNNLSKVRTETKISFVDMLISFFIGSWSSVVTTTTKIEGINDEMIYNPQLNNSKKQETSKISNTKENKQIKIKSKAERLRELKELLDEKVINEEEYEKEKTKILDEVEN